MSLRPVEIAVISDLHLGTYACRARECAAYLKSIEPRMLILNGDIIDGWQFSKRYFPPAHIAVIKEVFNKLAAGTRVIYITGNHDEAMRRYADLELDHFLLTDKAVIEINDSRVWIFHGDVFDHTTSRQARFWAKMGSNGYAVLLAFNKMINGLCRLFGGERLSLSKQFMHQFNKKVVKVDAFENKIASVAIEQNFDTVICGHIHQPVKKRIVQEKGAVLYLNSGDWVEHMTALEYYSNDWHLYTYDQKKMTPHKPIHEAIQPTVMAHEIACYLHILKTIDP